MPAGLAVVCLLTDGTMHAEVQHARSAWNVLGNARLTARRSVPESTSDAICTAKRKRRKKNA
eukprot:4911756-Amphidinium_carterae.1